MDSKDRKILLTAEFIRIISTIVILYFINIPIYIKIILIMLFDKLDCSHLTFPYTGPLLTTNTNICKTDFYQKSDKITDSICYIILFFYITTNNILPNSVNYILFVLLVFRLIGTYIFLTKNKRKYLVYFPNFYLDITLALSIIITYPILNQYKTYIIVFVIVCKILTELYLHGNIDMETLN